MFVPPAAPNAASTVAPSGLAVAVYFIYFILFISLYLFYLFIWNGATVVHMFILYS
jgi:hypothetical protein